MYKSSETKIIVVIIIITNIKTIIFPILSLSVPLKFLGEKERRDNY